MGNLIMNDYCRGFLFGMLKMQEMIIDEISQECENRKDITNPLPYSECCAFLGVILCKRIESFMVEEMNTMNTMNQKT